MVERSGCVEKSGGVERFNMAAVTSITALGVGKLPPAAVGTWSPLGRTCEERSFPGKASPAAMDAGMHPARVKEMMTVPVAAKRAVEASLVGLDAGATSGNASENMVMHVAA